MWVIFDNLLDAQAYADAAAALLPKGPGDVTTAWDVPHLLTDDTFAVFARDGEGVEVPPSMFEVE